MSVTDWMAPKSPMGEEVVSTTPSSVSRSWNRTFFSLSRVIWLPMSKVTSLTSGTPSGVPGKFCPLSVTVASGISTSA